MPTLGHICRDTRARAAKCWNFGAIFTPKNRSQFSIIQTDFWKKIWNLETICNNAPERFFRNLSSNWIYLASKLVKKRKIWRENFFLLNVCGFCREKNSKNSGRDGQNIGHLVQPVKLFLDQSLLIKGQLFSPNPRSGVGFCREKNSKNSGRDGQICGHLVQPVQLFESTKFRDYTPTLTCYISWLVHFFFLTWEITGTLVFYPSKTP